jgi:putative transport protein
MISILTFFAHLIPPNSAAQGALTLALAITIGLVLGGIRVRGLRLGISAVLFSALAFGQLGLTVSPQAMSFIRDFSLILFVYAIGLQVGPGFFDSLRAEGLRLNILALIAIALGVVLTAAIASIAHVPRDSAAGLFSGAYTTTPGLAAGQEVLRQANENKPGGATAAMASAGLAYAVTYPFGVFGPALVIIAIRRLFRVKIAAERSALAAAEQSRRPQIVRLDLEVTNAEHAGKKLKHHPLLQGRGVVLSRLLRDEVLSVPTAETEIRVGDVFRAVGPQAELARLSGAMGRETTIPADLLTDNIQRREIVVTRTRVLHRSLRELDLIRRTGVTIAGVSRSGVELIPIASLKLKFGDRLLAVGPLEGLKQVEQELGNSPEALNQVQLIPIFLGVVLGVIVGSIPMKFPGLSIPMRIGLAGGPMLAAIALSQLGNLGAVVWYLPVSANQLIRDFGLAVFLACVGFESGGNFLQRVAHGGLVFIAWGAVITVLPVFLVAVYARLVMKMNFVTLAGWIAGAMTSTPALLFASEYTGSESPAVAYAAVAPLSILSPVLCTQLLVMWLIR